jgi:hypothetical protein
VAPAGTTTFLEVAGEGCSVVTLTASLMSGVQKTVEFTDGARADAV